MILSRLGLHSFFNPPKSSISPHFLEEMSRDVKKPHGMQLTPWVFRIEFFFYTSKGKVICVKEYAFNGFETIGVLSNHTMAWRIFLRRLFFGFSFLMPTIEHERMDNLLVIALLKDRSYALIIEL